MSVREMLEQMERETLSPRATLSACSRGRMHPDDVCEMRTCFMRDRDRIIHSKAFRRLKHKTQVFISPEGDHYRTRLTHTLEVSQIGRTVARGLRLNEDLVEAIALGHDLGHTPFGHAGERALDSVSDCGFRHNEQSLRVVEKLEKGGCGLNLTAEVRDGIVCHTSTGKRADTLEGQIVHYADRIAYINHDIDDALRAGILCEESIPAHLGELLGRSHSARINSLVHSAIRYGEKEGAVGLEEEYAAAMEQLWVFMLHAVYKNPVAKGEESKGMDILKSLYEYFYKNAAQMPEEYRKTAECDGLSRAVCDYIAGMTDRFAVARFEDLFIPKFWSKI